MINLIKIAITKLVNHPNLSLASKGFKLLEIKQFIEDQLKKIDDELLDKLSKQ